MSLLIGFLTFILVVNCLFLALLVLVQLPKKEAGAGLAFGAGAVDTLIGAGSGNALTKMTKYAAGLFLGLAVLLAILNAQRHRGSSLQDELSRNSSATLPALPTPPAGAPMSGSLTPTNPVQATPPSTSAAPAVNLTPTPLPAGTPSATPPAGAAATAPANGAPSSTPTKQP